jgi:glycosyltransferase involved in cell wall biosynthesis
MLDSILPLWKEYPIDKFVFYDDNSTDNTLDIIDKHLPKDRYVVLNDRLTRFHEAHHRSRMLEYSRESEADIVMSIDADEILSKNLEEDLHPLLREYEKFDILLYWYNVVENSLGRIRQDPLYKENYRSFILPMNKTKKFDLSLWKYHTPRVPSVDLPKMITKRYGVIHLQSMNERYYALKQLWYKHHEFVEYRHSVQQINSGYDPVVNNLNFQSIDTPTFIVGNMRFDSSVFDEIEKVKGYKDYILQNFNQDLVTFGQKYVREINENI